MHAFHSPGVGFIHSLSTKAGTEWRRLEGGMIGQNQIGTKKELMLSAGGCQGTGQDRLQPNKNPKAPKPRFGEAPGTVSHDITLA